MSISRQKPQPVAPSVLLLQLAVNTTAEQSEAYGKVLCSVRGLSTEAAADMKSFSLDLGEFGGEIPERYDGLAVEITPSDEDSETDSYLIPASFRVLEIAPEAYRPQRRAVDLTAFLRSKGVVK